MLQHLYEFFITYTNDRDLGFIVNSVACSELLCNTALINCWFNFWILIFLRPVYNRKGVFQCLCLQCFDCGGWASGRASDI